MNVSNIITEPTANVNKESNQSTNFNKSAVEISIKENHGISGMNVLERVLTDDSSDSDDGSNGCCTFSVTKCSLNITDKVEVVMSLRIST